ncbi:hypothetical protein SKAU_G00006280 [Synaphobranchus kaupii]|uniref:EGF-like domain-containing protein n=1 Tax=Synaphobranchus kaupii TaxID=118154 RepID=A0A9Q1G950_SYNKA|nr:hypothetical protein SKAU_G00006280 [Synaphobranchus kaupii]
MGCRKRKHMLKTSEISLETNRTERLANISALRGNSSLGMGRVIWDVIVLLTGSLFTYGQMQENSTPSAVKYPSAAAVRSHFGDCPDSHSQFCFHGTCRFLIQEETPACVCHVGFVGMRCEHADLLAVVATKQQQQTMTTLLVMCIITCIITCALLTLICTLLQCCRRRGTCGCGQPLPFDPEKPSSLLTRGASCCRSETVV